MLATLGLSFLKKSFGQFSAPFSLSPNGKNLPPKEREERDKKKEKPLSQPLVLEKIRVSCPNPKTLNIWKNSGIHFF
jgi:hypothetical protein